MRNDVSKHDCWLGELVSYQDLGNKGQESYNSSKLISIMADYGYLESAKINNDKWGADLLFYRASDSDVKKVQLKGRVTFSKHYMNKDLYIAYPDKHAWYMYPHDEIVRLARPNHTWSQTLSWLSPEGGYSWNVTPAWLLDILSPWAISRKASDTELDSD